MKVNDIIGQMKEVGKWGFLREDSVAAAKSGIDKPTGLHRTGLEDYLRVIFPGADWVHDEELPQDRNPEMCKLRPNYRCEDLNLIVQFDGLPNFMYPMGVKKDLLKTQYYQDVSKYNVVHIPYFIQLTKDAVSKLFGRFGANTDIELFDGRFASLNDNNRCLPSCICSLGLMRMALEFVRFPEQYQVNKDAMEKLNCYTGVENLDGLYSDFSDKYQNGIADPLALLRVVINSRLGLNGRKWTMIDALECVEKIPSTLSAPKKENSIVIDVIEKAILRFKAMRPEFGIVKKTSNTCVDVHGVGYYFKYSTPPTSKNKKKESLKSEYWYGYNRVPSALAGCSKIVLCLVMADVERIVLLPKSEIEVRTVAGGLSRSSVGSPHWNIKLFRNVEDGSVTWHVGAEKTGEKILLTDII